MKDRETIDNVQAVCREVGNAQGKVILDIGCGTGALCRALADMGAKISGIDPSENAIELAINLGGDVDYQATVLEEFDASPNSFDIVIFCTSLHHIPDMIGALQGALKLVKPDGEIIVLEPQTDDPLYPVYRWLDDEKEVQIRAQACVDEFIANGPMERSKILYLNKKYRYASLDHLIEDMMEVDESRTLSNEARDKMATAYDEAVQTDAEGKYIDHWYRLDVLEA